MLKIISLSALLLFAVSALAHTNVVVVPLGGKMPSGDATPVDVLKGKTFSNADSIGMVGARPPAPIAKTGQTTSYETGDDGALQKGVTSPSPRFNDNADGTVTDNLTGLVWLQNTNCFGINNWATALSNSNSLANGACGLTDGSTAGDWRLPNEKELHSLVDLAYSTPALSNAAQTGQWTEGSAFFSVQSSYYWSSTTYASNTDGAWRISFLNGYVSNDLKTNTNFVWPVRD